MRRHAVIMIALLSSAAAAPAGQSSRAMSRRATPTSIIAASKPGEWVPIPADELMVIDLKSGARVVVQLAPQFAPVHVGNIQKLAKSGYWTGAAIYRVQDNYVAQWGNNETDKPLPAGVVASPPAEYERPLAGLAITPLGSPDSYAPARRLCARLAGRLRCQGGHRQRRPLLCQRRGRPRPVAGHRHGRRALCRDRPFAAPSRPGDRRRRAGGQRDRASVQPAARDRGARFLQGALVGRADRRR